MRSDAWCSNTTVTFPHFGGVKPWRSARSTKDSGKNAVGTSRFGRPSRRKSELPGFGELTPPKRAYIMLTIHRTPNISYLRSPRFSCYSIQPRPTRSNVGVPKRTLTSPIELGCRWPHTCIPIEFGRPRDRQRHEGREGLWTRNREWNRRCCLALNIAPSIQWSAQRRGHFN